MREGADLVRASDLVSRRAVSAPLNPQYTQAEVEVRLGYTFELMVER